MDKKVRSLYIRVLRGQFDCNRMPIYGDSDENPYIGATSLWKYMLKKIYGHGRKPVKLRNIAKEIGYFEKYRKFKQSISNSTDVPEEVLAIMIDATSRMPGCYKWARQFLVKKG